MQNKKIRTNSLRAWILAARPKTLTGATVPILAGLALAFSDWWTEYGLYYSWWEYNALSSLLCLLFAFIMQVDANFINDFFDCLKGSDREDRLGPPRACAEGWITLGAMKHGIAATTIVGCAVGLPLIWYGGLEMIAVGVACVLFAFLYTTRLSYLGAGDVLVLLFFGFVPVCTTYYIQLHALTAESLLAGLVVGLVIDTLLVVNNYRDREQDRICGKRTLIVRIGERRGGQLYLALGVSATLLCLPFAFTGHLWAAFLPWLYLPLHILSWHRMVQIREGRELNTVLGTTARNIFLYGVLLAIGLLL